MTYGGLPLIRKKYGVPARRGARVEVEGHPGTIIGSSGERITVLFDGDTRGRTVHPTWEVEYLDEGFQEAPEPFVGPHICDAFLVDLVAWHVHSCRKLPHRRGVHVCADCGEPWNPIPRSKAS